MFNRILLAGIVCFWAAVAYAQFPTDFERVLFPIAIRSAEGADGIKWSTVAWAFNHSAKVVYAKFPNCPPIGCSGSFAFPEQTVQFVPVGSPPISAPGRVIEVERGKVGDVDFTSRLRREDVPGALGLRLPVVFEEDLYDSPVQLLDIPTLSSRIAVRIYSPLNTGQLRVRTYAMEGQQELLREEIATLTNGNFPYEPAYAEIRDVPAGDGLVRVEIEPLSDSLRFWAFASSIHETSNEIVLSLPSKHH